MRQPRRPVLRSGVCMGLLSGECFQIWLRASLGLQTGDHAEGGFARVLII